jgi:hypothetical protein
MLHHLNLDPSYWAEVVTTIAYLKARLLPKAIGSITPKEL